MWPWEHAAVGYLCYSPAVRLLAGRRPPDRPTLALLFGTQLPDLVDKPLSWGVGLFPTGYALAHSVFVAVPVGIWTLRVARRRGRSALGWAFLVGYWSHLAADALSPLRVGRGPEVGRLLWPLVVGGPYEEAYGLTRGLVYLDAFAAHLRTLAPTTLAVTYLLLPALTLLVWLADGRPGLAPLGRAVRGVIRRLMRWARG